jgi:hypothetical protein
MHRYGDTTKLSPRFLAAMAHTTTTGTTVPNVETTYSNNGMVTEITWPELVDFTWDQFYSPIPPSIIPLGQRFLTSYTVTIAPITINASDIAATLAYCPVWIIVDLNKGLGSPLYHGLCLLNPTTVWNSYAPSLQTLQWPIKWAYKVLLTPKNMSNVKLVQNGTEWGFYVPAIDGDSLVDKANNFGYPLPVVNNLPDWPNVKADIVIPQN